MRLGTYGGDWECWSDPLRLLQLPHQLLLSVFKILYIFMSLFQRVSYICLHQRDGESSTDSAVSSHRIKVPLKFFLLRGARISSSVLFSSSFKMKTTQIKRSFWQLKRSSKRVHQSAFFIPQPRPSGIPGNQRSPTGKS